jgi:hypothetical protein
MKYEKIQKILNILNFSYELVNGDVHRFKKDDIIITISEVVKYPKLGNSYTDIFKYYIKTKNSYKFLSFKTEEEFYNFLHKTYNSAVRKIKINSLLNI